jgi:hypothetical protein
VFSCREALQRWAEYLDGLLRLPVEEVAREPHTHDANVNRHPTLPPLLHRPPVRLQGPHMHIQITTRRNSGATFSALAPAKDYLAACLKQSADPVSANNLTKRLGASTVLCIRLMLIMSPTEAYGQSSCLCVLPRRRVETKRIFAKRSIEHDTYRTIFCPRHMPGCIETIPQIYRHTITRSKVAY